VFEPRLEIFRLKREMVAPVLGKDRFLAFTNNVKFLMRTEAEPCPWKVESRAGQRLQLKNACVELATLLHVAHMEGYMIEFQDSHRISLEGASKAGNKIAAQRVLNIRTKQIARCAVPC